MLAVRVLPARADSVAPALWPPGAQRRVFGRFDVTWIASTPYSFVVELPDGLLVGEAIRPLDPARIRALVEAARGTGAALVPPEEALGLVFADGRSGRVHVAASVRSVRAYRCALAPDAFAVATTYRGLRALGTDLELDEARVGEFLTYRYVSPPHSLCRGVRTVPGGETWLWDVEQGGVIRRHTPVFPSPSGGSSCGMAMLEGLSAALSDDTRIALEAHRRPVLLLSGGADSTLLGALTRRIRPETGSASSSFSFVDADDPEDAYATSAARHLGLDHRIHRGSSEGYLRGLVLGIDAAEEPLHHLQSVMLYLLFEELAAQGADAVLCGEGADGLCGEDAHAKLDKYAGWLRIARRTGLGALWRRSLDIAHVRSRRLAYFGLEFGKDAVSDRHVLWTLHQFADPVRVRGLLGGIGAPVSESRRQLMGEHRQYELLQQFSLLSLLGEAAATLSIWGRLAEAAGLSLCAPFTAPRFIDRILRVPWDHKLREPKRCVRDLLRLQGVPEEIVTRPKLGFGFPYRFWAPPGALLQPGADLAAERYGARTIGALQGERPGDAMILWGLIGLDLWQRLVLEDAPAADLADEVVARHRAKTRQFPARAG